MAKRILNRAKIGASLLKDVRATVGSISRMNAPGAIGYVFNPSRSGKKIDRGMFVDRISELKDSFWNWVYYLDFKTGVLRRVAKGRR